VLVGSIVLCILLSGISIVRAISISSKQKEPTKGEYNIRFVESYIEEKETTQPNQAIIPCFYEYELLFNNSGRFAIGYDAGFHIHMGLRFDLFEKIVDVFPDPLVRNIGDYIYLIYDTDKQTRLFLFYSLSKSEAFFLDGIPVIMKKELTYKDFANICIGNSLEDVEGIDPVMSVYRRNFDGMNDETISSLNRKGIPLTSIHLLSDGILKIEYERSGRTYEIKNVIYEDDFVLDGLFGKTCYKILEDDYID
jgi:hypothetical protein